MDLDLFVKTLAAESGWPTDRSGGTWTVIVPVKDSRSQTVRIEALAAKKSQLVRFTSVIGPATEVTDQRPLMALKINADLALGALAISGKDLVITDTVLEGAGAKSLVTTLLYLAEQGDRYEKLIFGADRH